MKSGASFDVAVIGAGAVGLACAAELARAGRDVVVLERHARTGMESSSHNSEVIHAGLYYPPGSIKAKTCLEGSRLVYARCARHGIPHRRIGKVIVACDVNELGALEEIERRAHDAGAEGIEALDGSGLRAREPRVRGIAGLWSPNSGIVDSRGLLDSYQAELEACGGTVVFRTRVMALERRAELWRLGAQSASGERVDLEVEWIVNAAGLESDRVAELAGIDVDAAGWRLHWCKGDYFGLEPARGTLTRHLVYPVPSGAGLGVHVTLDLDGRTRFGPDAHYVSETGTDVDEGKAEVFARAVQRYLPEVRAEDLFPEMAGIRAKLAGPGDGFRDFVVAESSALGAPAMVHLIGIESPGLTASEALGRRVRVLVG